VRRLRRRLSPEGGRGRLLLALVLSVLRLHAREEIVKLVRHVGGELLPLPFAADVCLSKGDEGVTVRGGATVV
jgi:hypothetical protein